jgi:hypothetical protein
MTINKNYIIIGLVVIATVLIWMNINKKDLQPGIDYESIVDSLNISISIQNNIIRKNNIYTDSISTINTSLSNKFDSLSLAKQKVKHIYHEVYNDIPTASNSKLDSIVRANWR